MLPCEDSSDGVTSHAVSVIGEQCESEGNEEEGRDRKHAGKGPTTARISVTDAPPIGSAMAAPAVETPGERRHVTVMFCDLQQRAQPQSMCRQGWRFPAAFCADHRERRPVSLSPDQSGRRKPKHLVGKGQTR